VTHAIDDAQLGEYQLSIAVADGHGGTDTATVNVSLTNVNDPPETYDHEASGNEDTPITVNLTGSDVDGTVASFTISTLPDHGTLMLGDVVLHEGSSVPASSDAAAVTFVPDANWNGDTSFTYAAVDNDGASDATPATATITVDSVNDPPTVSPSSVTVSEEGLPHGNPDTPPDAADVLTAKGHITYSDVDTSDTHTLTLSGPTGTLSSGGQTIHWTGGGSGSLVGHAGSDTGTPIVTVNIDNQGVYDVTLSGPLDHPNDAGENTLHFDVGVNVADNHGGSASGSITVNVEDDMPVAYDVHDASQASQITFNLAPESETGNLLTGSNPPGSFGADGGHVDSIAGVGGGTADSERTPTVGDYDLQVTGKFHGTLKVDSDNGDYIYTPPAADSLANHVYEQFTFTLIDNDGDTASAQLSMLIDDPNTHTS
jgi:T1SS-143 domain-containing protein